MRPSRLGRVGNTRSLREGWENVTKLYRASLWLLQPQRNRAATTALRWEIGRLIVRAKDAEKKDHVFALQPSCGWRWLGWVLQ